MARAEEGGGLQVQCSQWHGRQGDKGKGGEGERDTCCLLFSSLCVFRAERLRFHLC